MIFLSLWHFKKMNYLHIVFMQVCKCSKSCVQNTYQLNIGFAGNFSGTWITGSRTPRGPRTEDPGQRTQDRRPGQRTQDRDPGQKTQDKGLRTEDPGQGPRTEDPGQGPRTKDPGQRTQDRGLRTDDQEVRIVLSTDNRGSRTEDENKPRMTKYLKLNEVLPAMEIAQGTFSPRVFLRVLRFPSLLKNQYMQIPI